MLAQRREKLAGESPFVESRRSGPFGGVRLKTVLLLDDDAEFRSLVAAVLRAAPLDVVEAETIVAGQQLLAHISVDLIIVDGLLPDGDGVAFVERVRAHNSTVPVIGVSVATHEIQAFERLARQGAVSIVLFKPLDVAGLSEEVQRLLAMPASDLPVTPPPSRTPEVAALYEKFANKLPDKLRELEESVRRAKIDHEAIADARAQAHRLRGSAGAYGHSVLGEAVGYVEDLLVEALADTSSIRRYLWEELGMAVTDARLCLERGTRPDNQRRSGADAVRQKALLVVDDDPDFLHFVRNVARKNLFSVIVTPSPAEAIQRARETHLSGAVLDVLLADQTSFSLAREIRSTDANADIPIAFVSADHRLETRVAAVEAGGMRFLEKPISEEAFAALAQQLATLSRAKRGKVLIVDDDVDVSEHYAIHLREAEIAVETIDDVDQVTAKLDEFSPDVLLLDVNLPGVSGLDVCRAIKASERYGLLPILIVTAQSDDRTRVSAFRAGASDVIVKPVLPEELLARVGVQIERELLQRERADKDALSGLLSRRALIQAFQKSLATATREGKPLALVLLDIDHFKQVNDTYGHLVGDGVISRLGRLLRQRFRISDIRGRWGGEEFMVIFPGENGEFAKLAADLLLGEFSKFRFKSDDGEPFGVTATAGVAAFPEDGRSISTLVRCADERLYEGKHLGRNRVVAADFELGADRSDDQES